MKENASPQALDVFTKTALIFAVGQARGAIKFPDSRMCNRSLGIRFTACETTRVSPVNGARRPR